MNTILYVTFLFMTLSASAQLKSIESGIYGWKNLPVKVEEGRETRHVMEGTSAHFEYLEIHATTQMPGIKPRPAHANEDIEEIIIVKEGKLQMTIGDQTAILGAGSVMLVPPQTMHALENIGDTNLTYYVMRFRSKKPMSIERGKLAGGAMLLNKDSLEFKTNTKGGRRNYFDRPTAMCENFEMHVTALNTKGPSHDPHAHIDSEIILVIEGNTEVAIDNKKYAGTAGDLYFINSKLIHGVSNASGMPCSYFAFKWR